MIESFRRVSTPGDAVELWLGRAPEPRSEQRQRLRAWLAVELAQRDPRPDLNWRETSRGPVLSGSPWRVSLSYCGTYLLCGLSRQGAPGVDMAQIADFPGLSDVASLYFGPQWVGKLAQWTPSDQAREFARAWSALEARQKACGIGLQEHSATRDDRLMPAKMVSQIELDGLWISAALAP